MLPGQPEPQELPVQAEAPLVLLAQLERPERRVFKVLPEQRVLKAYREMQVQLVPPEHKAYKVYQGQLVV